jgi:hypothetical protein
MEETGKKRKGQTNAGGSRRRGRQVRIDETRRSSWG